MAGMTAAATPPLPSRLWAGLSTRDFTRLRASGQARQTVAVLPVAAIEQHGPHLPLSVDATLLQGVIDAALPLLPAALPALFLPPQVVGLSPEHIRFPGTLTLSPATVIALWTEIGECVARAGVKKLLLFNGHGGQVSVMDIVARALRTRCGLLVYSASWFSLPLPDAVAGQFSAEEHRFGIHAGVAPPRRTVPSATPFWATAKAPSWAGRYRTTMWPARWAMPPPPQPTRAARWWTPPRSNWCGCCRNCTICRWPRWWMAPVGSPSNLGFACCVIGLQRLFIQRKPFYPWDALHNPRVPVAVRIGMGRKASFCRQ